MGNNDYKVNRNGFTVSTTMDNDTEEKKWSLDELWKTQFTVDSLIDTLQVIDIFKKKYPNDEIIDGFEEIVRQELCMMFGGSLYKED
jgi:hypothetical protein